MFSVTILGNNSALPAYGRYPTAQIITLDNQLLLIDCGEGTQIQMSKYKIRRSKINNIFISHLHGDHYFGLAGLITSMGLLGRENDLNLYAPAALKKILDLQFEVADTRLPFTLNFFPLEEETVIVDAKKFTVECFKTQHRIACWGFVVREKKQPRKIDRTKIGLYDIPSSFYDRLKNGEDYVTKDGNIIKNDTVTIANTAPRSYAFSADTIYDENLVDKVKNVSLLYHETTYLKDMEDRAAARFHSTTEQAATIATKAMVEKLIIGHFSSKYELLDSFLEETAAVFSNTELALDGVTYKI